MSDVENTKLPVDCFIMNKEVFVEKLKYGPCLGCNHNRGQELHTCIERVEIYNCNEKCNCCDLCTRLCDWEYEFK